ncbi:ABC transporter [Colletotrichum tofieldiae]|uniref:ABC transporter n=1 Tax=Colletotrichum tofieldiae TaxID=708197 RepID=A0A166P509_9PEZI|nr:ABC transporter [Colletotrichum tofieldiae]
MEPRSISTSNRTTSPPVKRFEDRQITTKDFESQQAVVEQEVGHLARQLSGSHAKPHSSPGEISMSDSNPPHAATNGPINPYPGTNLDPRSPSFDARAWIKAFVRLTESDPKSAPRRALGVAFRDLGVCGWSTGAEFQRSVGNVLLAVGHGLMKLATGRSRRGSRVVILRDFEGVIEKGEMLLVLGPPGSGCSTLLRTLSSQTADLEVSPEAYINYRGIDPKLIRTRLRGDVLYNAELDTHLAHLTVGETLAFASRARSVRHVPGGFSRQQFDLIKRDVVMAAFGLTHAADTRVGDDTVRGVSSGERKRVSIAEAALTGAKFQCWDNSTRGLDSANAIGFCRNLRLQANLLGVASAVSIYQAPQSAYDLFDKVTVVYEGRQIFFGRGTEAKVYFEDLGFLCPERQTVPDFLTSMTSPHERLVRTGFENMVPRTPEEFAQRWKQSKQRQELLHQLASYEKSHPSLERLAEYQHSRRAEQARVQRETSPYTISYTQQVSLTFWRAWRRLLADPGFTIASLLFNLVMALILGSMFYNLEPDSSSFYYRGGIIFFSLMFNAFGSQLEVLTIYAERSVVEKHNRYAFYHQSAQAIASYLCDLPYKVANMLVFNVLVYLMAGLRREAGAFFFFCLVTLLATLSQSAIFRTLASITRTSDQAMIPSALLGLGLMIYTGFTVPTAYMPGWSRWMGYINPLAYSFEALMANEFHSTEFGCAAMVPQGPGYEGLPLESRTCSVVGARPGSAVVSGDSYINVSFGYYDAHRWRNVGVLFAFTVFFFGAYLFAAEHAKPPKTRGEILIFRRGKTASALKPGKVASLDGDVEAQRQGSQPISAEKEHATFHHSGPSVSNSVFHWEDLCYDIKVRGGAERRLLDHVDGWVKPGISTVLMGVSGAGKTTLLDVLATRVSVGVVSGDTLIDGTPTDATFQHRVGYVQQQDLHLSTMTVREALEFSALLRQSAEVPRQEKLQYVEHVIDMLEMREFAGAVIGVPGEGLNVEQRKRLTIGVELAARPQLLVFFDEPTSGLDAQTSWAISTLIKKLASSGQAVLCTIHQPSAILFDQFDRLLLIAPGGKTVYFGDIGDKASTLISYFERNGAPEIEAEANPAEWMLRVIKPPEEGSGNVDWHETWRNSPEYKDVKRELNRLCTLASTQHHTDPGADQGSQHREFVSSFPFQFWHVLIRTFKHFWRSPVYMWSKISLIALSSLYLGFSYTATNSIQGLQNQLWAIFLLLVVFININEQIMPMFVPQRALYESRERPSKIYRWSAYVLSNMLVEMAWNSAMAVVMFVCWYYPVGFVRNTTDEDRAARGLLVFLLLWAYLVFTSIFAHLAIVWIDLPETAGVLTSLFWMLCILFCGVGVPRADLPAFWTFMYRVSPATYLVGGIMTAAVANADVVCADHEVLRVSPPAGANTTCGDFLGPFADASGGRVLNVAERDVCGYCPVGTTNDFLAQFDLGYDTRWRDFGLVWVYVLFNVAAAMGLYWVFRVPRGKEKKAKRA